MKYYSIFIVLLVFCCAVNKNTQSMHSYTGGEVGCGNFIVYKLTPDNKEYVSIAFNASDIEFTDSQSYGIGKTDILEVKRKKYAGAIDASLCNDVMVDKPKELLEEIATSGMVEILVSEPEQEKAKKKEAYKATIVLRKVTFNEVTIDYLRIENINVGWLPG